MRTFMLFTWPLLFGWVVRDIDDGLLRSYVILFAGVALSGLLLNLAWRVLRGQMWVTRGVRVPKVSDDNRFRYLSDND